MCAGKGMSCDIVTSVKITVNGIWPNVRRSNCAARFVGLPLADASSDWLAA